MVSDAPVRATPPRRQASRDETAAAPRETAAAPRETAAAPRSAPPREIELKYLVRDLASFQTWLETDWSAHLDGVVVSPAVTTAVEDVYFDTPHRALERHGFGARLRRRGHRTVLTVKSSGRTPSVVPGGAPASRAIRRRIELEAPATTRLDPDAWPESPARELVEELRGAARLRALFTIRQQRHERRVTAPDGAALFTLDEVEVHAGRALVGSFVALEVESSDGRETLLHRLATLLEASGLVTPEPRSKEEIAEQLVKEAGAFRTHELPKVPKAPGIAADDTLAEAGRKLLRMHLARMLAVEAGTRSGEDIEDLHKMRVATRRMRAMWRVFDGAYKPRVQRRYVRELRAVAAALGLVRDLDVMLEDLAAYLTLLPEDGRAAMQALRADWEREREEHRVELIAMLDSRDYRNFVEDYLDFTETIGQGEVAAAPGTPQLVRHTAAGRIWTAYEHVRAHATTLAWADVPALHALRIDCKRLRYTLESFREVLPPRTDQLIAQVVALQDHLGLLNDADVAAGRARTWLTANAARVTPESLAAVRLYLDTREAEVARLRRRFSPLWRRVEGAGYRRSLALALATL